MRICLITHHFPPQYYAGAEQYAYRLALEIQRQGHAIEVVAVESISQGGLDPTCAETSFNGLKVQRLSMDLGQAPDRFEWSYRNPQLGAWVREYLAQTRPDWVHVNSGYLLGGTVPEAAMALGIPVSLTLHDYWFLCPNTTLLRTEGTVCGGEVHPARCAWCQEAHKRRYRYLGAGLSAQVGNVFVAAAQGPAAGLLGMESYPQRVAERRAYLKDVFEKIDLVISPSRFLIEKFNEYGLKARCLKYLPFGLAEPEAAARAGAERANGGLKNTGLAMGFVGQLAPHKGVHLLVAAFQRLHAAGPPPRLELFGGFSGPEYERRLRRLSRGSPQIVFHGRVDNARVKQALAELDVLVVPSVWYENRPTVIVEAQAAGVPVVAARIGGITELVTEEVNGLLFEAGRADSLQAVLQRLLDEPGLYARLRLGRGPGLKVSEEVRQLLELFETVRAGTRPAAAG